MKTKVYYSFALAAALMLGACSSSDDLNGGGTSNSDVKTSYVSVNINNVGAAPGSRGYETGGGKYEDGEGIENAINNVRFYFFNADGTPYLLNSAGKDEKVNYLDVVFDKKGQDHDHTVESITNAVLVLNGESSLAPASMLAVVNPDAAGVNDGTPGDLLGNSSQRFSVLRTSMEGSNWKNDKGFVMSNSVYKEAGTDVCSTQLGGKLYTNADDATSNPVDIYVERVLAKVGVSANTTNDNWSQVTDNAYKDTWKIKVGTLQLAQEAGQDAKTVDVYAWIQGWGIADANGKAQLCKQIKVADWTDAILGITPWSTPDYHRCFWSNSSVINNTNPIVNKSFNSFKEQFGGSLYAMPNTPDKVVSDPINNNDLTKVLVAAKLGYKDGDTWKAAEICEYKGQEFLGISDLKKVILNETKKYYIKNTKAAGDTYDNLTADNITFSTSVDGLKDYQVVPKLNNVTELYRVADDNMVSNSPNNANVSYVKVTVDEVNQELAQNPAEIRTDGDTYYYTPIQHLGKAGSLGEYGVVRNHSYKITIDDIKGWGTPVYDPDKVIVPSIPSNDKTYLAARVNVLSWRVVESNVNLDQTNK